MVRVAKIMVVLGLLVLCGSVWAVEPNLVSHWKLDEGSGDTAYDSVGNNDGTLIGDPCWVSGKIGDYALDFDGDDDYVDCGDKDSLDFGSMDSFSITAWVKTSSSIFSPIVSKIVWYDCPIYGCYREGYTLGIHQNKLYFGIRDVQDNALGNYGNTILNDDEWHYVAAVRDTVTDKTYIYVDGYLDATPVTDITTQTLANSVKFEIGKRRAASPIADYYYFDGSIDDVRIYDVALSAEEIGELYHGQLLSLEIAGPAEVAENSQVSYKAIAHYDIGSPKDVTNSADWSVEPNMIASIDSNGLLTTEEIYVLEEDITIHAQYTEDTNTVEAEKAVSVLAICPTGTALSFDGVDDYVDCGTGPAITGTGTFTASVWVKPGSAKGSLLVQRSTTSANGMYAVGIGLDGRVQFQIYNGGYGFLFKSDVTVKDDLWHHIVAVRTNSTDGEIYIDGSLAGSGSGPAKSLNSVPVWIGRAFTVPSYFDGLIDDVCIYDRALSPEEIQANMHILLSGDEPNLVGYWDFDEGEGQIAYDLSSSGNNGYLGSDPCDVDSADPAWVESDAPIGICTTGGLIERNITRALESKQRALEEIEAALANENATIGVLEALFRSRDYGNLDKNDIVKAKQEIHSAVQNEQRSTDTLEKSIEKLEDSLSVLGYEVEPNGSNN